MRSFSASYDLLTKILSVVLLAVAAGAGFYTRSLLIGVLMLLPFCLTFLWSPRGYEVEPGALAVRRAIGRVRILLDDLREARLAGPRRSQRMYSALGQW